MTSAKPAQHIFGPVPSRRLGQSLGVDPFPRKICNFNCVYCQLGRSHRMTGVRSDRVPPERILGELERALDKARGRIDYLTLVGRGEPLLCASIGWLIARAKARWPALPVAVITNGSLLDRPEVRAELAPADLVMPTLDAADQPTFRRINRPLGGIEIGAVIDGIAALRREIAGKLWVEVMLVAGVNDDRACLERLRDALGRIAPDQVHINVAARPPAEGWVEVPGPSALARAEAILGEVAQVVTPEAGALDLGGQGEDAAAVVRAIVGRHPMREGELIEALTERFGAERAREALAVLERDGKIRRRDHRGDAFWEDAEGCFADG